MEPVKITTEFIKLNQLLKWVGAVSSGAEANHLIVEGFVMVNGESEIRKGKKIYPGDRVEVTGMDAFLVK